MPLRLMCVEAEEVLALVASPVPSSLSHLGTNAQALPGNRLPLSQPLHGSPPMTRDARPGTLSFQRPERFPHAFPSMTSMFLCNLPQLPGTSPVSLRVGFMSRLLEALLLPSRPARETVKTYHQAMFMRTVYLHSSIGTSADTRQWRLYVSRLGRIAFDLQDERVCSHVMRHAAKCGCIIMTGY